jgi:hypothetical protein
MQTTREETQPTDDGGEQSDWETIWENFPLKNIPVESQQNIIPVELTHVELTKDSLKHLVHVEIIQRKYRKIKHQTAAGFHVINRDSVNMYPYSFHNLGSHTGEGMIAQIAGHLPKFKTFFVGLSIEEVLQRLVESLLNILKVEDNDKNWIINGESVDNIKITVIVQKATLIVRTFYPTSPRSRADMKNYEREEKDFYVRLFHNPCYQPPYAGFDPSQNDAEYLAQYFGEGVAADMQYIHVDSNWSGFAGTMRHNGFPVMVHTVLPRRVVEQMQNELFVLSSFEKFTLPAETIQKVFFSESAINYRPCYQVIMSPVQVLDKLKEALRNFVQVLNDSYREPGEVEDEEEAVKDETFHLDKVNQYLQGVKSALLVREENDWHYLGWPVYPNPTAPLPVTSRYARAQTGRELGQCNFAYINGVKIRTSLILPDMHRSHRDDKLPGRLPRLYSDGSCYMDSWEFIVDIDPLTGAITNFGVK